MRLSIYNLKVPTRTAVSQTPGPVGSQVYGGPMGSAFKDLVIDAVDAAAAAEFWAATLRLTASPGGGGYVLRGDRPIDTVWINQVLEAHTVKNRVHLDVHTATVAELEERGARLVEVRPRWTVLADPDGQEFCAFVRASELPEGRLYELIIDCADPWSLARWWADRLGLEPARDDPDQNPGPDQDPEEEAAWLEGDGLPWPMIFGRVPEPKTVKNRVHWDVWGDRADYLAAGATLLRARDVDLGWDVLADPAGNEFCVFAPAD